MEDAPGWTALVVHARRALTTKFAFSSRYFVAALIIPLPICAITLCMNFYSIPRTSERRPISLLVKSRVRSREVYVDLLDISEGGCKIRGKAGFAQLGDRVMMRINGINAPLGTIAWMEGAFAGVVFEGEMHPAVVDYLCEQAGQRLSFLRAMRR